jgi:hypothetical protein
MWMWRNGLRPKTLVLCAVSALLGIAGGTDLAPASTRAADAASPRVRALSADGPRAAARVPGPVPSRVPMTPS